MSKVHHDTIDNELERIRQTQPAANPGDYREGGGTDNLAHKGVRQEKIGSDPEPGDFNTDPINPDRGTPDMIPMIEQDENTYAQGSPELSNGAMSEPFNDDETLATIGSAIRPEDTIDESEDDYTEDEEAPRRK